MGGCVSAANQRGPVRGRRPWRGKLVAGQTVHATAAAVVSARGGCNVWPAGGRRYYNAQQVNCMGDLAPKTDIGALVGRIGLRVALLSIGPVGAVLNAVLAEVMPALRAERLTVFAEELQDRLTEVPGDVLNLRVRDPQRFDLLEDGMWQAARASSRQRVAYLVNVVANGLKAESAHELDRRHVLRLLAEVNDLEVLILSLHGYASNASREQFFEKHRSALEREFPAMDSPRDVRDRDAVRADYEDHLLRLGLLARQYTPQEIEKAEFDSAGRLKSHWTHVTQLGLLLLREVGCPAELDG
jgi:hypothetical protein